MSHIGPAYGSLAANQAKIAAKRDPELDHQAQEWIEAVLGESFPDLPYEEALKDGVILCRLMNKLHPNAIPKYSTTGGSFKLRENISLFQNAARAYGLTDAELFQTIDLFEKRNIAQVTQCIFALGRNAQKKKFSGPILGPKMSDPNVREFTEEQRRAGQTSLGLLTEGMTKGSEPELIYVPSAMRRRSESTSKAQVNMFDDYSTAKEKYFSGSMGPSTILSSSELLANSSNFSSTSSNSNDHDSDQINLHLLIDLARSTNSSRMEKLLRLHTFLEEKIGIIQLLSLINFIKSSNDVNVSVDESPLNIHSSILSHISALFLLEHAYH